MVEPGTRSAGALFKVRDEDAGGVRDPQEVVHVDVAAVAFGPALRHQRDSGHAAGPSAGRDPVGVAPEPHRSLADRLDHLIHLGAFLVAQHLAEQAAEQADVFLQGRVLVGGGVGRRGGEVLAEFWCWCFVHIDPG